MKLFLVSDVAEQVGISADTVRNYCRRGLLAPLRDSSGRRLFTHADVRRVREIYLDNMARRALPAGVSHV